MPAVLPPTASSAPLLYSLYFVFPAYLVRESIAERLAGLGFCGSGASGFRGGAVPHRGSLRGPSAGLAALFAAVVSPRPAVAAPRPRRGRKTPVGQPSATRDSIADGDRVRVPTARRRRGGSAATAVVRRVTLGRDDVPRARALAATSCPRRAAATADVLTMRRRRDDAAAAVWRDATSRGARHAATPHCLLWGCTTRRRRTRVRPYQRRPCLEVSWTR